MARTSRIECPGGIHHITAKSPSRRLLFNDDHDRQRYLQLLAREIRERQWRLLTFCLLSNHLHLVIETPAADLGPGFKRLHEDFVRYANKRRKEAGHLFGDRFYNGLVTTDRHMLACFRYVARNPVKAGICKRPHEWPWSAHSPLAGLAAAPSFLDVEAAHRHLGATPEEARHSYVQLVTQSDASVLSDLRARDSAGWLLAARDEFAIAVDEIAAFLGVSRATAYRRLVEARENAGTVPSFSFETQGTVP